MNCLFQREDVENTLSTAIEKYADMVRRICFLNLSNKTDVDDVFQEVFLQYCRNIKGFENEQHEKAWICKVTFNKCKDIHKSFWVKNVAKLEEDDLNLVYWQNNSSSSENPEALFDNEESELLKAVMSLPDEYKKVVYMHYYEGWTIPQVAKSIGKNLNTVYTILRRAKAKIKITIEEEA